MGNNDYEQALCFQVPDMNSTFAVSALIPSMGEKWAPIVADYFQVNNCSSNLNATNRCCNILRLLFMYKSFDCNVQRIYNNLYLKYGPQQNLFWYHLNCNPGICPQLSIADGAGICDHTAEIPYVFGTVGSYDSTSLPNCTWDNQSRIFSNQIIANWISTATIGKPLQQWSYYDPSILQYFYITPYQNFASILWNGSCAIFDQIEQEQINLLFGNNNSAYYYKNTNIIVFSIISFLMLIN
jgi:hypothetical protein